MVHWEREHWEMQSPVMTRAKAMGSISVAIGRYLVMQTKATVPQLVTEYKSSAKEEHLEKLSQSGTEKERQMVTATKALKESMAVMAATEATDLIIAQNW